MELADEKRDQPSDREKERSQSVGGGFTQAFEKQNSCMEIAIKSLDNLNDQILQFIFAPKASALDVEHDLTPRDRDTLKASMALMRCLLVDAQTKFRKMVEDNKRLATRIDGSILAANEEVNALRVELVHTNKKLEEISEVAGNSATDDLMARVFPDNDLAVQQRQRSNQDTEELERLTRENEKLRQEAAQLQREVKDLRSAKKYEVGKEQAKADERKLEVIQIRQELTRAKEALQAMKGDRKRLKSEKVELLSQMKQLYSTLEDKEAELRDFIRKYEQRMKESDDTIKQLALEKEESEHEKWEILKRARDAAERSMSLKSEVDIKDKLISKLETELIGFQDVPKGGSQPKLINCKSLSQDSVLKPRSMEEMALTPADSLFEVSTPPKHSKSPSPSVTFRHASQPKSSNSLENLSPIRETAPSLSNNDSRARDGSRLSVVASDNNSRPKRRKSPGPLSRWFGKSRTRRSIAVSQPSAMEDGSSNPRLSILTQDNYQEKLEMLVQAKQTPISKWKASHVLAWLEIEMSMPLYGKICAENIKSGKVLLGLSDSELSSALCLNSPLHRRKLRLALEELRTPSSAPYPKAQMIDHTWVAHRWIQDLGLPQYSDTIEQHLVDGRLLNALSKKDLEKHLNVHRKFHQVSVLHGVELLRQVKFDKEVLLERRSNCEDVDCDPLVWTNHRLMRWVDSIDLDEYSSNLKMSGVHGAVLVLEPTFNTDAFAAALGIPPSKSYVRRHLAAELDNLVRPARAAVESSVIRRKPPSGGSVGRAFVRSYKGPDGDEGDGLRGSGKRLSFRGSLGRALGRKAKQDLIHSGRISKDDIVVQINTPPCIEKECTV